jgi:PPOX class probable F420-dependent enzyme
MERSEAIRRLREARVGSMATVRPDGSPHVVPFVFALVEDDATLRVFWAVDHKTKSDRELRRVTNLRANPAVEIEVNSYEEDWRRLWWVRASGTGREVSAPDERAAGLTALCAKYAQYAERPPAGPVVVLEIDRVVGWADATTSGPSPHRREG